MSAKQLIGEARNLEALQLLEQALRKNPEHVGCLSHYAMLIALERGQVRRGLELVQAAMEIGPEDPEVHLNTARIYLKAGMKTEALHCLRAGLARAPQHPELVAQLTALGVRRRPVIGMLHRDHIVNRLLGRLRHWWQLRRGTRR